MKGIETTLPSDDNHPLSRVHEKSVKEDDDDDDDERMLAGRSRNMSISMSISSSPKIVNIGTSIMVRRLSLSGSAASYIDAKEREGWRAKSEVRKRGVRHKLVRR